MAVSLDDVKQFNYIDGNADDALLTAYLAAAKQFIKNAVGDQIDGFWERDSVQSLYDIAVNSLVGTWYQYRIALSDTQTYAVDLTLNSIIVSLRGAYLTVQEEAQTDEDTNQSVKPSN